MSEIFKIKVAKEDEGKRLDAFFSECYDFLTRSAAKKHIVQGVITVNGAQSKPAYKLQHLDELTFEFEEPSLKKLAPQDIGLDIRYEDEDMLVVNKPKNMLTHPTPLECENTLVNALLYKYGENLSTVNGDLRRGIVHRLDRNTSGLLMVAKNDKAHVFLANQIKEKQAKRKYLAIVSGNIEPETLTISTDIGRNPYHPHKMAVLEFGKPSVTHLKVLERFRGYAYVELELETGRTHQIRVHLSHIGHPIVNDTLYGGKKLKVKTTEQVLQAYQLTFNRVSDNIVINVTIDPDEDVAKVLNYLKNLKD